MSIYDKASLVLIPSGTKTGKVYSQKPVSGDGDFTFTRASAATRVSANGNIEKETQNLLLQSNSFDTTWTNTRSTETSGQSGYDGTSDAWLLESTATATSAYIRQVISNSGVYTMSVYAKAGTSDWVALLTAGNQSAYFDLANGVLGSASSNVVDSSIESIGNGWYRCSATLVDNNDFYVFIANGDGNATTNSGDNIYIQDAQLEQGLVARDVITTTTAAVYGGITDNTPRLDYTDSSCPALLLEPQRTNVVTQSEYYDTGNGYFNSFALHDIVTNTTATKSPTGDYSASKIIPDTSNSSNHNIYGSNVTSGTKYAVSIFAKAAEYNYLLIRGLGLGGSGGARFNISTGVVEGVAGYDSATIEDYGNGWYRCIAVGTATSTTGAYYHASPTAAFTSFQGNNSDGIYIYGAQIEAGSYATSYIPTYGSSVSRVAEASLKTGVADLINDGDGTLYMEVTPTNFEGDQRFGISDNIGANRIVLRLYNPSNLQLSCVINSSVEVSISNSGYSSGNTYKIAGAWKNNDAVIYINGVQVATDTNCNITPSNPLTRISFDNGVGTAKWENPVSQTLYFPTRLSNEELAALTTI